MVRVWSFTMRGAGAERGGFATTTGVVVVIWDPWAFVVVRITAGTCVVATKTLPWAFVVLVMMVAMALAESAGTAVEAWLARPGSGGGAALLKFSFCGDREVVVGGFESALSIFAGWFDGGAALKSPLWGEAGSTAAMLEGPVLLFAAWSGEVPESEFMLPGAGFDAGALALASFLPAA